MWNKLHSAQVTKSALGPADRSLICCFHWDVSNKKKAFRLFMTTVCPVYVFAWSLMHKQYFEAMQKQIEEGMIYSHKVKLQLSAVCWCYIIIFQGTCHSNYEYLSFSFGVEQSGAALNICCDNIL